LIVGLITSAILLIIAAPSFLSPQRNDTQVDNLGILQVLWLVGDEVVADIDDPTTDKLRRAGMIEYDFRARRRLSTHSLLG
jgi:hypothetical protein